MPISLVNSNIKIQNKILATLLAIFFKNIRKNDKHKQVRRTFYLCKDGLIGNLSL